LTHVKYEVHCYTHEETQNAEDVKNACCLRQNLNANLCNRQRHNSYWQAKRIATTKASTNMINEQKDAVWTLSRPPDLRCAFWRCLVLYSQE